MEVGRFLELNHTDYGIIFYEVKASGLPCVTCGGNDAYTIVVAADNDFSLKDGAVYPADARVGGEITICDKKLMKEIRESNNMFRIQPKALDEARRQLIADN